MSKPSRFSRPARRTVLVLSLALLLAPIGIGAIAQNRTLDAPRSAGTVGERYDGYAVVRDPGQAASLAPVVDQVNAERRKLYAQRAAADGVPIDQIGRIYAGEIVKSAPAGTWFLQESGQWVKK
jgi:uncharacterized protein YdbL (DUF1318 family)